MTHINGMVGHLTAAVQHILKTLNTISLYKYFSKKPVLVGIIQDYEVVVRL